MSVENAAKFLDSVKPGWENLIDLDKLDMQSSTNCVLGQVYADNVDNERGYFWALDNVVDAEEYDNEFCGYTNKWKDQVRKRMNTVNNPNIWNDLRNILNGNNVEDDLKAYIRSKNPQKVTISFTVNEDEVDVYKTRVGHYVVPADGSIPVNVSEPFKE